MWGRSQGWRGRRTADARHLPKQVLHKLNLLPVSLSYEEEARKSGLGLCAPELNHTPTLKIHSFRVKGLFVQMPVSPPYFTFLSFLFFRFKTGARPPYLPHFKSETGLFPGMSQFVLVRSGNQEVERKQEVGDCEPGCLVDQGLELRGLWLPVSCFFGSWCLRVETARPQG